MTALVGNVRKALDVSPDITIAASFIEALTGSADTAVTWQTFADDKSRGAKLTRVLHGTLAEHGAELVRLNRAGAGIFVTVNRTDGTHRDKVTGEPCEPAAPGASLRSARNVASVRAAFVDADEKNGEHLPAALAIAPHIRVRSGGGEHAYWLLRAGESPAEWPELQQQLARALGTDRTVHDLPRVMRVPGFAHQKGAPVLVTFERAPGEPLTIAKIRQAFPDPAKVAEKAERADRREAKREGRPLEDDGFWRRWGSEQLEKRALDVRAAPDGEGRSRLNAAAYALGAYVPHILDRATVESRLLAVATREWERPMARRRAESTIQRALDDATPWHPSPRAAAARSRPQRPLAPALNNEQGDGQAWQSALLYSERGALEASNGNAIAILENDEEWRGVFGFNRRANRLQILRPPPHGGPPGDDFPRDLTDSDVLWSSAHIESRYKVEIAKSKLQGAIGAVASKATFDPVVDYLNALEWDGTPRIDRWLADYFEVEDTPLHRAFSARWLISAVARAFKPGSKVDTALILEGPQGRKKSSGLRAMCPDNRWFTDQLPELRDQKSAAEILQGPWIVELAELSSLNRTEVNRQKAFLTTQFDNYRQAYAANAESHPRQCVFAGSTNDDRYLTCGFHAT